MQTLSGLNSYTGGTTVNDGTLSVGNAGTLGNGPLAVDAAAAITSTVSFANNQMVSALSGSQSGTGSARVVVGAAATLTVKQSSGTTFGGSVILAPGATAGTGGALVKSNGGTLEIDGGLSLGNNSSLAIGGGTLRIGVTSGNASVGTGAIANVTGSAVLELAGTVSALSDPTSGNSVSIVNNSSTASGGGLVVFGRNQQVGAVSGTGDTVVGDGTNAASLTAKQILQNTLTINANSTVTIAPSAGSQGAIAASSFVASSNASADSSSSDSSSDPFTAIQAAIASGSISSAKGQQLENRIAAIERLVATDPGLDVSLLEDRVLAALPSTSVWPSSGTSPLMDSGSDLLAVDGSTFGSSSSGGTAEFAPAADFGGSPAAVPEPLTILLLILGGIMTLPFARHRFRRYFTELAVG